MIYKLVKDNLYCPLCGKTRWFYEIHEIQPDIDYPKIEATHYCKKCKNPFLIICDGLKIIGDEE